VLAVVRAPQRGKRLRPDKGLNFPGTTLRITPLTARDRQDLGFVACHADLIGYSFVQDPGDVAALVDALASGDAPARRDLGLVLKIETGLAVRHLPELIVAVAGHLPTAVMIARGDLAVEVGFERLAEVQEELLWLCEAAHVPVIWATQVLEQLAQEGLRARGEVTDAAMGARRVRHAQQRPIHPRRGRPARRSTPPHAGAPGEEDAPVARPALLGRPLRRRDTRPGRRLRATLGVPNGDAGRRPGPMAMSR
jgi:hypothetical protein